MVGKDVGFSESLSRGVAERCIVGFTDGVMEGMFDMKMIGDGIAEGCTVGSNDGVTVCISDR